MQSDTDLAPSTEHQRAEPCKGRAVADDDTRVGWLLVGHGSRETVGTTEFLEVAREVARRRGEHLASPVAVEPCFLEFAEPTIAQSFHRLVNQGVRRVVVVPVLLFAAGHAKRDIPEAVAAVAAEYPTVRVEQISHLGCSPDLLALSQHRYCQATEASLAEEAPPTNTSGIVGKTLLILVGRGSFDPDAIAEMHEYARQLASSLQATQSDCPSEVEVAFVAMAQPALEAVLATAALGAYERIVVQPHLLFGGVLVERITSIVAEFAGQFPRIKWVVSGHLGPAPQVASALLSRIGGE